MCGLLSYKRICPYTPSRKCVLYPLSSLSRIFPLSTLKEDIPSTFKWDGMPSTLQQEDMPSTLPKENMSPFLPHEDAFSTLHWNQYGENMEKKEEGIIIVSLLKDGNSGIICTW